MLKKQIVHFTESFGGGVLQGILELSKVQFSAGYKVTIVYLRRANTPIESELQDMFGSIDLICMGNSSLRNLFRMGTFSLRMQRNENSIVHAHSSWAGFVTRIAAMPNDKANVFYTPHSFAFERRDISSTTKRIFLLIEKTLGRSDKSRILGCSYQETRISEMITKGRADFLGNYCVPLPAQFTPQTKKHHDVDVKRTVIGAGRICEQKNPSRFAKVANSVGSACQFNWIGDGDLIDSFRGTNIGITGWVSRESLAQYYFDSDIFLLTSDWEGLPFTVIEAFSCAIPVVAFEIDGIRDYVLDGYNGFVVQTIDQAKTRITQLLLNDDLYKTLSTNAEEFFNQNFNKDILEVIWESKYGIRVDV